MNDPQIDRELDALFSEIRTVAEEIGETRYLAGPPYTKAWHRSAFRVLREWKRRCNRCNTKKDWTEEQLRQQGIDGNAQADTASSA